MAKITVEATGRTDRGKNNAKRLRVSGQVPAVVYGGKEDSQAVALNTKQVTTILRSETGHNTIFTLKMPDGELQAMVKDWQVDPLKGQLLHVDLVRIAMDVRMRVKVPVHTFGEPQGVKLQGGVFETVTREVEIECLPTDIPTEFRMDVTALMIGDQLRAGDVPHDSDEDENFDGPAASACTRGRAPRGRRETGGGSGSRSGNACGARSHQEGQEGRRRRRG